MFLNYYSKDQVAFHFLQAKYFHFSRNSQLSIVTIYHQIFSLLSQKKDCKRLAAFISIYLLLYLYTEFMKNCQQGRKLPLSLIISKYILFWLCWTIEYTFYTNNAMFAKILLFLGYLFTSCILFTS